MRWGAVWFWTAALAAAVAVVDASAGGWPWAEAGAFGLSAALTLLDRP